MARIRTIKPEFPQSETIGHLSRDARLLFVQLWTVVDDHGKARASSRLLASLLYPYDDDVPALIDGWLDELEREGCIQRYEADGTRYLCVRKWAEHQKVDRPTESRLPDPPIIVTEFASPREGSRGLDAGPRTMDLVPRTKDQKIPPEERATTEASNGAATAAPAPSESFTAQVTPAISQSLSGARLTGKGGKLMRWVVDVLDVLNERSGHDAGVAAATWRAFADSDAWRFKGADPSGWARALGDWLANGHKVHPSRNGTHNSAIKAEDDRTETPLSPERQAQIVAMRAKLATMPGATVAAGGAP